MFLENLPLCLKVGLSHLRNVTDFYICVFEVGEEEQAGWSFDVLAL